MPRIDLDAVPQTNATGYPAAYGDPVQGRLFRRLGPAGGITDFGANHVVLKPGAWASQRHWHEGEDELVVIVAGAATLIDDSGRTAVHPGDVLAFPKGDGNGHHLINESDTDCVFIAIGQSGESACHYPDIDLLLSDGQFRHKDGTPY